MSLTDTLFKARCTVKPSSASQLFTIAVTEAWGFQARGLEAEDELGLSAHSWLLR